VNAGEIASPASEIAGDSSQPTRLRVTRCAASKCVEA